MILLLVGLYVGWVVVGTELEIYQLGTSARTACREMMMAQTNVAGTNNAPDDRWLRKFKSAAGIHGVQLQEGDYRFDVISDACNRRVGCECEYSVLYHVETPWPLLDDFFTDFPKYKRTGEKRAQTEYLTTY